MQAIDNGELHHGLGTPFAPGPTPVSIEAIRSRDTTANWVVVLAAAVTIAASVTGTTHWMSGHAATFAELPPINYVLSIGLACGLMALALTRRGRAARVALAGLAGATLVVSLGAGIASFLPSVPRVFAPFVVHSPLRGLVLDLSVIAALLVAVGRARNVSNAFAVIGGSIGLIVILAAIYRVPLLLPWGSIRFSTPSAIAATSFAIAIIASNGTEAWPTRLFVGPSVAALLRRWLLPFVVVTVLASDAATLVVFSHISPAIGSALNTVVSLVVAGIVAAYLGRIISYRLERSYAAQRESERQRADLEAQLRQGHQMEALGRLAGGVAHDFNNILAVIIGWGELLRKQPAIGEREANQIGEIVKAGRRGADLTRQLLTFASRQAVEPRLFDVNAVLENMETMLGGLIGDHITVETMLEPKSLMVFGDPGQVEQVIVNLVVNARDAMPAGGRLAMTTASVELDPEVTVARSDWASGQWVRICVRDTGVGMSADVQSHIFEPFFTTKDTRQGTGLGLSTAFGIVQKSGGFITVDSVLGVGSTFEVFLPRMEIAVEDDHESEPEADAPDQDSLSGTETILVVDDNAAVGEVTAQILRSYGYAVLSAESGPDALALADRCNGDIDLVVTDVVMPEMSGPALVERLLRARPDVRVLYVSGYTSDVLRDHGIREMDIELLKKPFEPAQLVEKVRSIIGVLEGRGKRREARGSVVRRTERAAS